MQLHLRGNNKSPLCQLQGPEKSLDLRSLIIFLNFLSLVGLELSDFSMPICINLFINVQSHMLF